MDIPNSFINLEDMRPNFSKHEKLWAKYMDTYIGGENIRKAKYMPKLDTETNANWAKRLAYAAYSNHIHRIVQDYIKYIFKMEPIRDNLSANIPLIRFMSENGRILTIDGFFRELAVKMLVYGEIYVFIDHTTIKSVITDAERQMRDDTKYLVQIIAPQNVPVNNSNRVVIKGNKNTYFVIYDDKIVSYKDGKVVNTTDNFLGFKPVIKCFIDEDADGYGESLIRDVSDKAVILYNLESTIWMDYTKQTFSPFMLPISPELIAQYEETFGVIKDADGNTTGLDLRMKEIMPMPEGATGAYLTKDSTYIVQKQDYVEKLSSSIRRDTSIRLTELIQQSGIAKSYDFQDTNTSLKFLATVIENNEKLFWELWYKVALNIQVPDNVNVEYIKDFDIKDKQSYIKALQESYKEYKDVSPTWSAAMLNAIASELHKPSKSEMEKIQREITAYISNMFKAKKDQGGI